MSKKSEARFQAEPWTDDEFYAICEGIQTSPTLRPEEMLKAVTMLEKAHRALTGQPAIDPDLFLAAFTMGCIDIWNEFRPGSAISPTEALRLIFVSDGTKSPDAIRSAIRRPPYDQIRINACAHPVNRSGIIGFDVETSRAYQIVTGLRRVDAMAQVLAEEEAAAEQRTREQDRKSWLKLARDGSKFR